MAAGLAAIAGFVSSLEPGGPEFGFFVIATGVAVGQAVVVWSPTARRQVVAFTITGLWLVVTLCVDAITLVFRGSGDGDFHMIPIVKATYLGLTATVYHEVALHLGLVLVALSPVASAVRSAHAEPS